MNMNTVAANLKIALIISASAFTGAALAGDTTANRIEKTEPVTIERFTSRGTRSQNAAMNSEQTRISASQTPRRGNFRSVSMNVADSQEINRPSAWKRRRDTDAELFAQY